MSATLPHQEARTQRPVVAAETGATCRVEVFRFKRGADAGHFDSFDVPVGAAQQTMDLLQRAHEAGFGAAYYPVMVKVIEGLKPADNGRFLNYDRSEIAW